MAQTKRPRVAARTGDSPSLDATWPVGTGGGEESPMVGGVDIDRRYTRSDTMSGGEGDWAEMGASEEAPAASSPRSKTKARSRIRSFS